MAQVTPPQKGLTCAEVTGHFAVLFPIGRFSDSVGTPGIYVGQRICQSLNHGCPKPNTRWLSDHRQKLESTYEKSLSDIVCVITPFGNQTEVISRACRDQGIKVGKGEGEMVVDTVHAIQGAERPVVIFSPVYSKHADGPFIDRSNSMLNVAVSRAKDHFFVFGDMDVFTTTQEDNSPRGVLANYLFNSPQNALEFPALPRYDLVRSQPVTPLYNAEEHDQFLIGATNKGINSDIAYYFSRLCWLHIRKANFNAIKGY